MKILIAEPDKNIMGDIKEILRLNLEKGAAIQFIEASGGKTALAEFILEKPNLAIIDARLPEVNAFKFLSTLRYLGKDKLLTIPVIVIIPRSDRATFMELLKLGAKDFLTKPIDIEALITKVESYLK